MSARPYSASVCNNACWSTGEIAVAFPAEAVAPFVAPMAGAFVSILQMTMINRSLGRALLLYSFLLWHLRGMKQDTRENRIQVSSRQGVG
jgi:hypothetical protein